MINEIVLALFSCTLVSAAEQTTNKSECCQIQNEQFAMQPPGKNGRDGKKGTAGQDGEDGEKGQDSAWGDGGNGGNGGDAD